MHFLIAVPCPDAEIRKNNLSAETPEHLHALIKEIGAVALLSTETVHRNPALYEKQAALFNPVTALIGASNDLSFKDRFRKVFPYSTFQHTAVTRTIGKPLC